MPSVLSPINLFHLDLGNLLYRATILELKSREAKDWAQKIDRLDLLARVNGDVSSELDEDELELIVSDLSTIKKEKDDRSLDIQRFHAELDEILNSLQGHVETPLESVMSSFEHELVQEYGKKLISWSQGIRSHLIEILGRTTFLFSEKEEQKKKKKMELMVVQELVDQMAVLCKCVETSERRLEDVVGSARMKPPAPAPPPLLPTPPDAMDVDVDEAADETDNVTAQVLHPASDPTGIDFSTLLKDTRTNLEEFHSLQHTFRSKVDSLHHQAFLSTPPIIPVRDVEIDLDLPIRQIIVEEFQIPHDLFFLSLTEEIRRRGDASMSSFVRKMENTHKLVLKLVATFLGCEEMLNEILKEMLLSGRQDHSQNQTQYPPD